MGKEKKKPEKDPGTTAESFVQLIVFKIGDEEFGIRIQQVKEVTLTPPIAKVPKAPPFILGVANIRGDIMAVMDLEERLGMIKSNGIYGNGKPAKYTLVIEHEEYTIGITVQEVPVSLTITSAQIDKAPDILRETQINKGFLEGIAKVEDKIIIILDISNMLSFDEIKKLSVIT